MPPDVDLEDVGRWEDQAERLLALPAGCWEWVGEVAWDWDVGRFGGSRGGAVFAGRTTDGVWGSILLKPTGELRRERGEEDEVRVYDAREARFAPLVGRFQGAQVTVAGPDGEPVEVASLDENAEAANILHSVLGSVTGEAYSSWATWDDARGGVVLHRSIPLEHDEGEVLAEILFPGGGDLPTALELVFPAVFRSGRLPRWTIRDATVKVRAVVQNGQVYPSSEAFSFGFGVLGFRFTGAQAIDWKKITRCPAPVAAPAPPAPAP
jgi:hypothetical protein